jgi:uncharacterized membrane protein
MVDVTTQIKIAAPIDKVAEYVTNPDNAPLWYINIKSVKWQTPKPLSIGTKITFIAHFLGKILTYTYEFTEVIPGEKVVMRTADGPFPMETTYSWKPIDNNDTLMVLRNAGKPNGFSKLMSPFIGIMMKKANKKDLMKLKSILEK